MDEDDHLQRLSSLGLLRTVLNPMEQRRHGAGSDHQGRNYTYARLLAVSTTGGLSHRKRPVHSSFRDFPTFALSTYASFSAIFSILFLLW